ncbi:N-6 DNA methylase [Bacillus sp. MMSF_3328]|uniref:restriction endonuclease subunit M n=1 Tax=Bacillus sp. MMSF_3328 TaxID=3047080 RepID=UPI00273DF12E|nr:N-6 DNA methylase [Bacillus sp. MMSF_3328]
MSWQDQVIKTISDIDQEKKIIKHIDKNSIKYNEENLNLGRKISVVTDEELVRALLVCRLHYDLNYPLDGSIELEQSYEAGRPKKIKPRIDVIVRDNRSTEKGAAFLFIELKAPNEYDSNQELIEGQLFNLALLEAKHGQVNYLVYYSIDTRSNEFDDRSIIIDFEKYNTYSHWDEQGRIALDTLPKSYGIAKKRRFGNVDNGDDEIGLAPLDKYVTSLKFFSIRRDLHKKLWGGGAMSYNDIFSNLVKLFLAKIYDEETTNIGEQYEFQIEFNGIDPETPEETFNRINSLFKKSQQAYLGYSDSELKETVGIDREKISSNSVAYVVEKLQDTSFRENYNKEQDLLGEFFEGIVSDGFKQDKGQFFTHSNIVDFIIDTLDIAGLAEYLVTGRENNVKVRLPYICDPSAGSGNFLIRGMTNISERIQNIKKHSKLSYKSREFLASNAPEFTPNVWAKEFLYGVEIHSDLAMGTKVNMVLHGDGNINIFSKSGLLPFEEYTLPNKVSALSQNNKIILPSLKGVFPKMENYTVNNQFDVIMTNPPFSIELDTESQKALPGNYLLASKSNSETVFIERWFQLLRENGRIGVVLPDSIFDNKEDIDVRIFLYRFFEIKAIVSLPMVAFKPYTPTKTSILFARKKTQKEVMQFDAIWESTFDQVESAIKVLNKGINKKRLKELETQDAIFYLLKGKVPDEELEELKIEELVTIYSSLIKECISNPVWLTFSKVSEMLSYDFLIAHAEEVGYKRSKKLGEQKRPNQLYYNPDGIYTEPISKDYDTIYDFLKGNLEW